MTMTLYTFRDTGGDEWAYNTTSPSEAEEYAKDNCLVCIAHEFERSDEDVAWDFSEKPEVDITYVLCRAREFIAIPGNADCRKETLEMIDRAIAQSTEGDTDPDPTSG